MSDGEAPVSMDDVLKITDQAEADALFEDLVGRAMRVAPKPIDRAAAEALVRDRLAYHAGYYSNEDRARVERLFRCAHPFFGPIVGNGPPSPWEAFKLGEAFGESLRKRSR